MNLCLSLKKFIFICGINLLLKNVDSVMQSALDRELKFCKQSRLTAVYSLADLTFVQFMDGQWMSQGDNFEEHEQWSLPTKEKTLRQLFFLNAKVDQNDYVSLIHGGMTGFLVSSSNFTSFPADTGLLMSTDHDYYVWIRRIKHCDCITCTHFTSWSEGIKDINRVNVLISGLAGAKKKVMHYIESANKLVVAYTKALGNQEIAIYSDSLNNVHIIKTFNHEQGTIKGLFSFSNRVFYFAERMLGTFDPVTETFNAEHDRKLSKGDKIYEEKPLLNLLDLFGCLTFEQDEQPKEFNNLNWINMWLNVVLGVVNTLLIGGVIVFCVLLSRQNNYKMNSRPGSPRRKKRSDR